MAFDIKRFLAGAGTGAATGSAFGPVGTGVGAVAGGLLGGFGGDNRPEKLSSFDKYQKGLYQDVVSGLQGKGQFADLFGYDPDQQRQLFEQQYARPAQQRFQREIIPGITGAFRGKNLGKSSYLGNALAQAGSDVQQNLDSQLAQLLYQGQQDSISRRLQALQNVLSQSTFAYQNRSDPFDQIFSGLAQGAGSMFAKNLFNTYGGGNAANPIS